MNDDESLFIATAESEHVEMYLKAILSIQEKNKPVKINTIAKTLNIQQPSVVQMLKKLHNMNLVIYRKKSDVQLTEEGMKKGFTMLRNSRLLEVLMIDTLKIGINDETVCGIEHHMNAKFTEALCSMLNHPRKCPHDKEIPLGPCCIDSKKNNH